jgi:hypothetical protein
MVYELSPGDVVRFGNAAVLTVLAVEGDLIRFGLETPDGASPDAGDFCKDGEEADRKHRRNGWECN